MKKTLLLITFIGFLSTTGIAQTPEEAKAWQEYMTPGNAHKLLAKEAGTWEGEVSSWMDPSQPPMKNKAKYEIRMIMNGLFQEMSYTSSMMGMPFTGKSITGYNNAKKEYESIWCDAMGSGFVKMTGFYDESLKTFNYKGTQTDPVTGKDTEIRQEIKWNNDNSFTMTMYGAGPEGKEMKFMEGTFKRTVAMKLPPVKTTKKKTK